MGEAIRQLRNDKWIEESPISAVVIQSELGKVCSRCFKICQKEQLKQTPCLNRHPENPENPQPLCHTEFLCDHGCKLVGYCSSECRDLDWGDTMPEWDGLKGAHKLECAAMNECENAETKINDYARLVGRILSLPQMSIKPSSQPIRFYGADSLSLWDLEQRSEAQIAKLHQLAEYDNDYQQFEAQFNELYGKDAEKTGRSQTEDVVRQVYDICRIFGRRIVHFDLSHGGSRTVGLGLYLNFSMFKHSCRPSLMSVFECSPQYGPLLKARKVMALSNLDDPPLPPSKLDTLTISCLEHISLLETFGTNFPFFEEIRGYLAKNCLTNECQCPNCCPKGEVKPMYDDEVAKYSIEVRCPSMHGLMEINCVIAAVCDCNFLTNAQLKALPNKRVAPFWPTETGAKNPNCQICRMCNIHPSIRAKCVRCGKFFEYEASGKFFPTGRSALLQTLERAENEDPNEPPIFECMNEANCWPNFFKIRYCERYALMIINKLLEDGLDVKQEVQSLKMRGHPLFDVTGYLAVFYKHLSDHHWKRYNFNTIALMFYGQYFAAHAQQPAFASQLITIANDNFCNISNRWRETRWESFILRILKDRYSSAECGVRVSAAANQWLNSRSK